MTKAPTYRPYLTEEEVRYIAFNLSKLNPTHSSAIKFRKLEAQIGAGLKNPAYELSQAPKASPQQQRPENLWDSHKSGCPLSAEEVKIAKDYAYTNNLMTGVEEREYEQEAGLF